MLRQFSVVQTKWGSTIVCPIHLQRFVYQTDFSISVIYKNELQAFFSEDLEIIPNNLGVSKANSIAYLDSDVSICYSCQFSTVNR